MTVAAEVGPPSTVRVKVPLAMPVPVRGTMVGEAGSELVRVREPGREPVAVGVKVRVRVQVWPGVRVVRAQGVVRA